MSVCNRTWGGWRLGKAGRYKEERQAIGSKRRRHFVSRETVDGCKGWGESVDQEMMHGGPKHSAKPNHRDNCMNMGYGRTGRSTACSKAKQNDVPREKKKKKPRQRTCVRTLSDQYTHYRTSGHERCCTHQSDP